MCLDAGASTGGFTDVLLSRGAAFVYAVDVGRGQLDPRLATDPRVHVMDRTNLRSLTSLPGAAPDLVTLDLSFISLRLVIPAVVRLVAPDGADLVALFKPQFELGREAIGKGGIVRDAAAAERAADDVCRVARVRVRRRRARPDAVAGSRRQGQPRMAGRRSSRAIAVGGSERAMSAEASIGFLLHPGEQVVGAVGDRPCTGVRLRAVDGARGSRGGDAEHALEHGAAGDARR